MTQSAEDSARAILRVFCSEDVRAGHALMYEAVKLQFLKSCSAEDFAACLAFAIEREWRRRRSGAGLRCSERPARPSLRPPLPE